MSQVTLRRAISHIGLLQIAIIILAVVTGAIHLYRGVLMSSFMGHASNFAAGAQHLRGPRPQGGFSVMAMLPLPLTTLFYLNFCGYIALVVLLYLPFLRRYQRITRWLLIAYTALTIIAWFVITNASLNVLAYVDKPIELTLIILLLVEDWQVRQAAKA